MERVVIRYKWIYRLGMGFYSLFMAAFAVIFTLMEIDNARYRDFYISDHMISILFIFAWVLATVLFVVLFLTSIINRVVIDGSTISIRALFRKPFTGNADYIEGYKKQTKTKGSGKRAKKETTVEIFYQGKSVDFILEDMTDNSAVLVDYLTSRCKKYRDPGRSSDADEGVPASKWGLHAPSLGWRKYVMVTRMAVALLIFVFLFFFQYSRWNQERMLWVLTVAILVWVPLRLILWQDAILYQLVGSGWKDAGTFKHHFLFNPDVFLATPVVFAIMFFFRTRHEFERFHIYDLGSLNRWIIIGTIGLWLMGSLLKLLFIGRNHLPVREQLILQGLLLFVTIIVMGKVVHATSLLWQPEVQQVEAELVHKEYHHHTKASDDYIFYVEYDGIVERYYVFRDTYYQYEYGDSVPLEIYETVFDSGYRKLTEYK